VYIFTKHMIYLTEKINNNDIMLSTALVGRGLNYIRKWAVLTYHEYSYLKSQMSNGLHAF